MKYVGKAAILDLDDTLADMRTPLMAILNKESGRDVHWTNWNAMSAEVLYEISSDRFFELALENKLLDIMQPHPETRDFMKRLHDNGIETTVLTARGWHTHPEVLTKDWFSAHDIEYNNLKVVQLSECKADYISGMDNVLFTVDDSPRHCNMYAKLEKRPQHVFAYDMPWTTPYLHQKADVTKINTLDDIGRYLEGL